MPQHNSLQLLSLLYSKLCQHDLHSLGNYRSIATISMNKTIMPSNVIYPPSRAGLFPCPVQNLKIKVDPRIPSVTLTWAPPKNVGVGSSNWSDVTAYHIRFKPHEREHYRDRNVDSSTTSIVLKGLIPQTTSVFEVRAQCGDGLGKWKAASCM